MMIKFLLALLLFPLFVPAYIAVNSFLAAWIWRHAETWAEGASSFARRQVRPLTGARLRTTTFCHLAAMTVLFFGMRRPLEILESALLLMVYVFVVTGLTLSLFAQMPFFKRVWSDAFVRLVLVSAPFVLGFLARGYSAMLLNETLSVGADNAPMAQFAGTLMMVGLMAAIVLMGLVFVLEFVVITLPGLLSLGDDARRKVRDVDKTTFRSMVIALFNLNIDKRASESRAWASISRSLGLTLLFGSSMLGCLVGMNAALVPFASGFGKVALLAIAFDFDAVPAGRCNLTQSESRDAAGYEPKLKALMLSTSREKALLVRRSPRLFDPVKMSMLGQAPDRTLIIERVVSCFDSVPLDGGKMH